MRAVRPVKPRLACLSLSTTIVVVSLLAASTVAAEPPAITAKREQARRVLAEVQQLDSQLGHAIDAYDGATLRLRQIRAQLSVNRFKARVARSNLKVAERRLAARLRDLYISGEDDSTLEVLLGSSSLDDVINRLDTVSRVSQQDTQILHEVKRFRLEVARRGKVLRHARRAQARIVAERAAAKARIEQGLADRQRLLSSIGGEIRRLQAQEAARQALLQAQARARLAQLQQRQQARLRDTVIGVTAQAPANTSGDANTVATVAPPAHYGGVVGVAMAQLGKPYVWAAAGPNAFDCSGLVTYAFAALGVSLPHSTYSLWTMGVYVPRDQLQSGDLVFFDRLGHMGIYIGSGEFIHAPHTGDVVKISSMSDPWYTANYDGARRIL